MSSIVLTRYSDKLYELKHTEYERPNYDEPNISVTDVFCEEYLIATHGKATKQEWIELLEATLVELKR